MFANAVLEEAELKVDTVQNQAGASALQCKVMKNQDKISWKKSLGKNELLLTVGLAALPNKSNYISQIIKFSKFSKDTTATNRWK